MNKSKILNKLIIASMVVTLGASILTGCQSKKSPDQAQAPAAAQNGKAQRGQGFNSEEYKNRIQEDIKSLVSDGTLKQEQADKIIEALSQNPMGFGGQRGQNNSNNQNNQQSNQNNQQNRPQRNGQNGQRNNALSQLVNDGVITQAQADAVMQKIRGSMPNRQNNQNNQNNQNTQGGQSTT